MVKNNKISPSQRMLAEIWLQREEKGTILTVGDLKNIFQHLYLPEEVDNYLKELLKWQAISITKENIIEPNESFDIGQRRKKTTYEINKEERKEDEKGILIK